MRPLRRNQVVTDCSHIATKSNRAAVISAQVERLFGYTRDELVGQPVEILVPDDAQQSHPSHRAGYMADPRPRPMGAGMRLAGRRRDGSTFPAKISLSAIDTDQGILITPAARPPDPPGGPAG
jgi:PAS domain S-box-containing protein